MSDDTHQRKDPVSKRPQPEFAQQEQSHPGWTGPMDPPPNPGENSYEGHGILSSGIGLAALPKTLEREIVPPPQTTSIAA